MSHDQFALNLRTLRGTHDKRHLMQKLRTASAAGFKCIGLCMEDVEAWTRGEKNLRKLHEFVTDLGMSVAELCSVDLLDSRGRVADRTPEFVAAAALGAPIVSVMYDESCASLEKARTVWTSFCDLVSDIEDVQAAFHFSGNAAYFNTLDLAWDIVNDGPPNGSLLLDLFDFWRGGSAASSLDTVPIELVSMIHVTDVRNVPRHQIQSDDRTFPGTGVMPLTHIISTLSRRGYDGMYSVEVMGNCTSVSCLRAAEQAYRTTRKLLGTSGPSHRKVIAYAERRFIW